MRRWCGVLTVMSLGLGAVPDRARAQALSGQVADSATARPVIGALLTLLDASGRSVAQGVSGPSGRFTLSAPAPGRYRLRIARIGFAPEIVGPFELDVGGTAFRRVVLPGRAIVLAGIEVESGVSCGADSLRGAGRLVAVWEQVRTALQIQRWSEQQGGSDLRGRVTLRTIDRGGKLIEQTASTHLLGGRGFESLEPERLAADGWVQAEPTGFRYYGPDAPVLLSEAFLRTHCLQLVNDERRPALIGVGFEPVPGRTIPDIGGVIWLDAVTAELRRVDFTYRNPPATQDTDGPRAGGDAEFTRLPDGRWVISRWRIRTPWFRGYREKQGELVDLPRMMLQNPGQ